MNRLVYPLAALLVANAAIVRADRATLGASKDNTLYEDAQGQLSNGAGQYLFAGATDEATGQLRRGLVAFEVAAAVPAGATVYRVILSLHMSRSVIAGPETVEIRRVLADWGEGASNSNLLGGGQGAAAATGDATWVHTFFDTDTWGAAGGDFAPGASAATLVSGPDFYDWGSTAEMVADVQSWLDDTESNFGWLLLGNEAVSPSAKRFDTKENGEPSNRPALVVDFAPAGTGAITGTKLRDLDADGITSGDPPLGGVLIDLFGDDGDGLFEPGTDDALAASQRTEADGSYGFAVSPGTYFVAENAADLAAQSLTQTDGGDDFAGGIDYYTVTVVSGVVVSGRDFANFRPPFCGDGTVDAGEACDDGNGLAGDCCSDQCETEPLGSPCPDDGDACTNDTCDGAGTCEHLTAPHTGCLVPVQALKASLTLKNDADDKKDQVGWKWIKGEATSTAHFGNPDSTDDYALCIYGGPGLLLLRAKAPAGGTCGGRECWKSLAAKGFKYKDKERTPHGLQTVLLRTGDAGKAKINVKGKRENLPDPPLPLTLPVTVQLRSTNGSCWEAVYFAEGAKKNEPAIFKGKAGSAP